MDSGLDDLPDEVNHGIQDEKKSPRQDSRDDESFYQAVDDYKRELISCALEESDGVQARAAELLGLKRTTLNEMMNGWGGSKWKHSSGY